MREKKRTISRDERLRIIEEGYRNDLSLSEIAQKLGSSTDSVKVLASRYGITAKYPKQRAGKTLGITVPKEAMLDWNYLTREKRYRAKEAAQMLGLISTEEESNDPHIQGS